MFKLFPLAVTKTSPISRDRCEKFHTCSQKFCKAIKWVFKYWSVVRLDKTFNQYRRPSEKPCLQHRRPSWRQCHCLQKSLKFIISTPGPPCPFIMKYHIIQGSIDKSCQTPSTLRWRCPMIVSLPILTTGFVKERHMVVKMWYIWTKERKSL